MVEGVGGWLGLGAKRMCKKRMGWKVGGRRGWGGDTWGRGEQ